MTLSDGHFALSPQFRFCTNTTQSSGDTLANKLRNLGFNVNREEVRYYDFSSGNVCGMIGWRWGTFMPADCLQRLAHHPLDLHIVVCMSTTREGAWTEVTKAAGQIHNLLLTQQRKQRIKTIGKATMMD